jgi:hypothetical protein
MIATNLSYLARILEDNIYIGSVQTSDTALTGTRDSKLQTLLLEL